MNLLPVHIDDLCAAHKLALGYPRLARFPQGHLGNGNGFSVRELTQVSERVTGKIIPVRYGDRRAGEIGGQLGKGQSSARLAAAIHRPGHIVSHAWAWGKKSQELNQGTCLF